MRILVMITTVAAALTMSACTSSDSSDSSSSGTNSYSGPGSHYTISADTSSFTIGKYENSASTSTTWSATGSLATETYGFRKLTVSSISGSGGPSVGATAQALEVPGFAMFIKPLDAAAPDQVIAAVSAGSCPTSTLNANWVIVKQSNGSNVSSPSQDTFGTFSYNPSTGIGSLPTKYSLAATTTNMGAQSFSSATCSRGIMRVNTGGDYATMYLTSGGGAIVNTADQTSADASYIFGLPAPTSALSGASFAGTYSGFVYMGSQASGSKFKLVKFTLTWSGSALSGTGYVITDPDTDTVSSTSVAINLTALNSPSNGFMTGTLNTGSSQTVACMGVANANGSGKQIINCAGADPGSTSSLFNFLLVSR